MNRRKFFCVASLLAYASIISFASCYSESMQAEMEDNSKEVTLTWIEDKPEPAPKAKENPDIEVVSPDEFQARLSEDLNGYLLDVRRPDEFAHGHLKDAHLLNWLDMEIFKQETAKLDKSKTIYIYCRSGRRSNEAANFLRSQGYKVVDLDGGILAWVKKGFPLTSE